VYKYYSILYPTAALVDMSSTITMNNVPLPHFPSRKTIRVGTLAPMASLVTSALPLYLLEAE